MKRKFVVVLEVIDMEAPTETAEESGLAFKDYIREVVLDLAFDVTKLEVSCENI